MTMHLTQLRQPQRQIPIRTQIRLKHHHRPRTVHRLNRIVLAINLSRVHILLIMVPVPGLLPHPPRQNNRRLNLIVAITIMQLSPILDQRVFQHHAIRQEKREARRRLIRHKKPHLPPNPTVIPLFRLLQTLQIFTQLLLLRKRRPINTRQHRITLIATPISPRQRRQLKSLNLPRRPNMRPRTQIRKLPLLIKGNHRILRQILNQLQLIALILFPIIINSLLTRHRELLNRQIFLHDLLHLSLNLLQLRLRNRPRKLYIIIKTILNRRPNRQLRIRKKPQHRLRQQMRRTVMERLLPIVILKRQNRHLSTLRHLSPQINQFTINLAGHRRLRQARANLQRHLINRSSLPDLQP